MTNTTQTVTISKVAGLMEMFRQLDPEMPAHTLLMFLLVAEAGPTGILQHELGKRLGLSTASITRNVSFLSKEKGINLPGHDLVISDIVREDRRQRRVTLSPKGEKFLAKAMKLLLE